nr:hypothetical protein [Tanacetum cinerariifolium]
VEAWPATPVMGLGVGARASVVAGWPIVGRSWCGGGPAVRVGGLGGGPAVEALVVVAVARGGWPWCGGGVVRVVVADQGPTVGHPWCGGSPAVEVGGIGGRP